MVEKEPNLSGQILDFIIKILIPSFIAISIKIATQIKKEQMSYARILMSYVVGIGCAYFIYPFAKDNLETPYIPIIVGIVSISGEKIAEFIIYKWNVDLLLGAIADAFKDFLVKIISGKK